MRESPAGLDSRKAESMGTRERAAKLLGNGIAQEIVASALGVTPSYISQLLADESFAQEVTQLRLINLENASERDGKYDKLEDTMLEKLEELSGYMTKPREVLGALAVLNKAVRRGVRQEQQPQVKQDTVVIQMPVAIQNKFIVNHANQVIAIGADDTEKPALKDLTTITSRALLEHISRSKLPPQQTVEVNPHGT